MTTVFEMPWLVTMQVMKIGALHKPIFGGLGTSHKLHCCNLEKLKHQALKVSLAGFVLCMLRGNCITMGTVVVKT